MEKKWEMEKVREQVNDRKKYDDVKLRGGETKDGQERDNRSKPGLCNLRITGKKKKTKKFSWAIHFFGRLIIQT